MLKKWIVLAAMAFAGACWAGVDVNQASAAELDAIKGIGPKLSSQILAERKKGPFKDWNDLIARTKGIGASTATKFSKEGLTVGGAAYSASASAAPAAPAKAPAKAAKEVKAGKTEATATDPFLAKAPAATAPANKASAETKK